MNSQDAWNSVEIAKLVASLLTPVVVALLGFLLSRRLSAQEQRERAAQSLRESQDRERREEREAEAKEHEDEVLRRKYPHIELTLECEFLGERQGWHLVTFSIVANNVGQVRHEFGYINFRLRGIKHNAPFNFFKDTPRVTFPEKILAKTNVKPPQWNYAFIEPGVTQRIPVTTRVSADCSHVMAQVEVEYDPHSPHTAEAVFAVPGRGAYRSPNA
ncbi:hypothetical protein [Mycolicibacterium fluoranthenivorans]|jgi:hypothetical protein|uniref:DUF4352 domain-containing protein n=1 Tax=Mycolicibacterium fluoranthenivorans TaxID=258505 RepID=A0A1G4WRE1_9MYCO|nr:hypothetical protein [Mycolicibacterium fluoranthenivorans]SCX28007.1 hypothetical protein SAMN02799620_04490 [Mycolicibacterium fluoranthenivorans]